MKLAAGGVMMLALASCESAQSRNGRAPNEVRDTAPREPDPSLRPGLIGRDARFRDEPWSYDGRAGRVVTTPHYRVYMTQTAPVYLGRIPMFLDAALDQYRTVATGVEAPLPLPVGEPMSTFVFRRRDEWERMTRQMLGDAAGPFLRIRRGGYAWGGTAVLFDLGSADTLTIAAHEGWHQFTQRTFKQALPMWLEESMATLCEGHRWRADTTVEFTPEVNPERREQLGRVVSGGRLRSLQRLALATGIDVSAGGAEGDSEALETYAQVWAAGLFLRQLPGLDGQGGGSALGDCIVDAAAGRMAAKIVDVLGRARAEALADRARGLAVLEAYFAHGPGGLADLESRYHMFVNELVR